MSQHYGDYEDLLRGALHAAVDSAEPADDGLERIRARLTTPHPLPLAWLMAVCSWVASRARAPATRGAAAVGPPPGQGGPGRPAARAPGPAPPTTPGGPGPPPAPRGGARAPLARPRPVRARPAPVPQARLRPARPRSPAR